MNHRDMQQLEEARTPRDIAGEVAALEHLEVFVERHTTLPTSELRKDIDVLKIEGQMAGNIDDALRHILGASRGAKLLGRRSVLADLQEAEVRLRDVQAELARRRGEQ